MLFRSANSTAEADSEAQTETESAAEFEKRIKNVESTNADTVLVTKTEDSWIVRIVKEGDALLAITMDDDTVIVEFGNNKNCRIPMHVKAIAEVESSDEAYEKEDTSAEEETSEEKPSLFGKKKK